MSTKEKQAKVAYVCPVWGCGTIMEIKEEGRIEGSIHDCKGCGEKLVFRGIFIAKIEEEIKEDKPSEEKK